MIYSLKSENLTVDINSMGAELPSVKSAEGKDLLWNSLLGLYMATSTSTGFSPCMCVCLQLLSFFKNKDSNVGPL